MTRTLPKGITLMSPGVYRVRVMRSGEWHNGGLHDTLDAAKSALALLPDPAPTRTPRKRVKMKAAERNIYPSPTGYQVRVTRGGMVHYGGTFATIGEARTARENIELQHPRKK